MTIRSMREHREHGWKSFDKDMSLASRLRTVFRWRILLVIALIAAVMGTAYYLCLPEPLFETPYSTVIEDRNGELMAAKIAADGQWRFPLVTEIPERYEKAVLLFEDKRFYRHPGVDLLALGRATRQNIASRRVVSGASTISMQVIRLSGKNPSRTFTQKLIETIQATRLELRYSKKEILQLYAAHAPFGGNVVGLEAASWRYFGRPPEELSWAESATLAVLPNSPGLIHPGRNREALRNKRDRLLQRMHENGYFDALTLELAMKEEVPERPRPLPQLTPHLLDYVDSDVRQGEVFPSTLRASAQQRVIEVLERHYEQLRHNHIHNAAAIIIDTATGEVLAYAGNTSGVYTDRPRGHAIDLIRSERSTGSILKPLLFGLMIDQSDLLPHTLIPDIPTLISGYAPQNFTRTYMGAVPASEAVHRSLNVPSVRMLQDFGLQKFHYYLKQMGMQTLHYPPEHYGLTLILGGAEGTLWDITSMYAALARHLLHDNVLDPDRDLFSNSGLRLEQAPGPEDRPSGIYPFHLNAGSVWAMFEAMNNVNRPEGETDWRHFDSARKVAWKTGTSFGHRDAWAVGITPEYVIGVWIGNASGEGRPQLTGVRKAGPVMFDLFHAMGQTSWFSRPLYATTEIERCALSGHRAGPHCSSTITDIIPISGIETESCPYHFRIHVDASGKRVDSRCADPEEMQAVSHFRLPPAMAWYYRRVHPSYTGIPSWKEGCEPEESRLSMELIYPSDHAQLYIPVELDGEKGKTVFEAAHQNPETR
ncbi:penicillin-binding protein 1C, partial [Balneolaceae bacterium ANBcel3]|nr:penicillin-binding protein 1C [Balneolaceae bacterium ANBcel3]